MENHFSTRLTIESTSLCDIASDACGGYLEYRDDESDVKRGNQNCAFEISMSPKTANIHRYKEYVNKLTKVKLHTWSKDLDVKIEGKSTGNFYNH